MKVRVYFNQRKKLFSVVDKRTGRVMAHRPFVAVSNAVFRVSEAGRQRVLRERRKNVHAYVDGDLISFDPRMVDVPDARAYYNPYTCETFIDRETRNKLTGADCVVLKDKGIHYSGGK